METHKEYLLERLKFYEFTYLVELYLEAKTGEPEAYTMLLPELIKKIEEVGELIKDNTQGWGGPF